MPHINGTVKFRVRELLARFVRIHLQERYGLTDTSQ
jgi:hypothetical protein